MQAAIQLALLGIAVTVVLSSPKPDASDEEIVIVYVLPAWSAGLSSIPVSRLRPYADIGRCIYTTSSTEAWTWRGCPGSSWGWCGRSGSAPRSVYAILPLPMFNSYLNSLHLQPSNAPYLFRGCLTLLTTQARTRHRQGEAQRWNAHPPTSRLCF